MQRDETFVDHVRRAEQRREILPLKHIQDAGEKNWRAAAWMLERLNPGEYRIQAIDAGVKAAQQMKLEKFIATVFGAMIQRVPNPEDREALRAEIVRLTNEYEYSVAWNDWLKVDDEEVKAEG